MVLLTKRRTSDERQTSTSQSRQCPVVPTSFADDFSVAWLAFVTQNLLIARHSHGRIRVNSWFCGFQQELNMIVVWVRCLCLSKEQQCVATHTWSLTQFAARTLLGQWQTLCPVVPWLLDCWARSTTSWEDLEIHWINWVIHETSKHGSQWSHDLGQSSKSLYPDFAWMSSHICKRFELVLNVSGR